MAKFFKSFIKNQTLSQIIDFPSRHDNYLDLGFANRENLFSLCEPLPNLATSDHVIVKLQCDDKFFALLILIFILFGVLWSTFKYWTELNKNQPENL